MVDEELERFEELLKRAITIEVDELSSCMYKHASETTNCTSCDFYLIKCKKDSIRERDFLNVISTMLLRYALTKEEWQSIDVKSALGATKKALSRFTTNQSTGEVGEVILFALLESERNAPQLVNKMALKTEGKMHVFGLDGIHMGVRNDEIRVYYGESKFRQQHGNSIKDAVGDLQKFHTNPREEEFEISLVSNYIDSARFGDSIDRIKEILNPYTEDKSFLRTVYAVFIGFNWESLDSVDLARLREGAQKFSEECIERHADEILDMCSHEVDDSGIDVLVEFFFIPFTDVKRFRSDFLKVIG